MPKFLTNRHGASEIEDLLKNSDSTLTLITPYFKLTPDFKDLLDYRSKKNRATTIILRKKDLASQELINLQGLSLVTLRDNPNLHAKCYTNGIKMVITSMNLYDYSMAHNDEMGILLDRNDPADVTAFREAMSEVQYVYEKSQPFNLQSQKPTTPSKPDTARAPIVQISSPKTAVGFCIRTRAEIPFNPDKPLCPDAYKKWKEFANLNYPEKFCHFSGEPSKGENSVNKPILRKNWDKAQKLYGLKQASQM